MKRTVVIGALFAILYFGLGMTSRVSPSLYCIECTSQCLMMLYQPNDDLKLASDKGAHPPTANRARPDRMKRGDKQPKGSKGSFGTERPMTADTIEHVMAVAKEIDPELAEQLASMCEKDPDAFEKIIRRQGRRMGSFIRLRDSDPELFEVKVTELKTDAEIFHLAGELRGKDVDDPSIQGHLVNLRGLVRVKTGLSIRVQSLYVERLERHLRGLRERLEDTSARFDEIVEERVEQLLQAVHKDEQEELKKSHQVD